MKIILKIILLLVAILFIIRESWKMMGENPFYPQ